MTTHVKPQPLGQRIPNGVLEDNYPRNMWWVAAHRDEVTTNPISRWLLETPVVLYRLETGEPAALYDRCPHRWAPLSEGEVRGDRIICPYHGMQFDAAGRCVHAPTQDTPPTCNPIPSYAVREAGAYIWIWLGDQDAINRDPPDVDYQLSPDWTFLHGYYAVAANWVLLRENVLDLTHIAFLHRNTFKQNDWVKPPEAFMEGETVCYEQAFDLAPLSPLFCAGMGLPEDKPVKRVQRGWMPSLAVSFSDWYVHDPAPEGDRADFTVRGCHIVTPSTRGRAHYFWSAAFDVKTLSDEVAAKTEANVIAAFDEDKRMLELMQAQLELDPNAMNYQEVTLRADGAGVRVRQLLNKKLAAESRSLRRGGAAPNRDFG